MGIALNIVLRTNMDPDQVQQQVASIVQQISGQSPSMRVSNRDTRPDKNAIEKQFESNSKFSSMR